MTPLIAAFCLLAAPLVCPVSGEPIPADAKAYDWNGLRVRFCCGSCIDAFMRAPATTLETAGKRGWTVATAIFDPVTGRRLSPQNAKGGASTYGGVLFTFQTPGGKAAFDGDAKRYGAIPAKSVNDCPVMHLEISKTFLAPGYVDFEGVRYFACCDQCFPKLRSDPGAYAKAYAEKAGPPKLYEVPPVWQKMTGPGG